MKISSKNESLLIFMKSYLCASHTSHNHSNMGKLNGHTTCRCECTKWLFCLSLSFLSSQLCIITVNRSSFLKPPCAYAFVLILFSHVRLCDLVDSSLPDSSLHGILQARILKWVAIPFSRRSSRHRDQT